MALGAPWRRATQPVLGGGEAWFPVRCQAKGACGQPVRVVCTATEQLGQPGVAVSVLQRGVAAPLISTPLLYGEL